MIYLNKPIPIIYLKYLDDKTIMEKSIKNYCKIYYTKDYYLLYKNKFYESKIDDYILIMYLMKELLKSDFLPFIYLIDNILLLKNIKCIKLKSRFKYDYKELSRSILCNIENSI